jgi:hypothetical protein
MYTQIILEIAVLDDDDTVLALPIQAPKTATMFSVDDAISFNNSTSSNTETMYDRYLSSKPEEFSYTFVVVSARCRAALICCTVLMMILLIVATDSMFNLPDGGTWLTAICMETVRTEPGRAPATVAEEAAVSPISFRSSGPSGSMTNPDGGAIGPRIRAGSSPCKTMLRVE